MSFSRILSEIKQTFVLDPLLADIMRIDLYADVPGYLVEWFHHNVRIAQKQNSSEWSRVRHDRKSFETLYFGESPNLFRIYDKTAQRRYEYTRLRNRQTSKDFATFEERYGHSADAILTRVERQYGGGRIPDQIRTLGQFQKHAIQFSPYEPLQFLPVSISEGDPKQLTGDTFVKAHGVLRLIERHGFHHAKRLLDEKTNRNTRRLFDQLGGALHGGPPTALPNLYTIYKEGVTRQISA